MPVKKDKKNQEAPQGEWYVIFTYPGYEDAVEKDLRQRIESMGMQNYVFDVMVPKEKQYKFVNNEKVEFQKKIFPGYVLVKMQVTNESWYMVRNTPKVRGFVGSGNTPLAVSPEELGVIKERTSDEMSSFKGDYKKGDDVIVNDGIFTGSNGKVDSVDKSKGKLKVLIDVFGRNTPVELDFNQVEKERIK